MAEEHIAAGAPLTTGTLVHSENHIDADALKGVSLFEACDQATLSSLQRVLKHKSFGKGEEIVKVFYPRFSLIADRNHCPRDVLPTQGRSGHHIGQLCQA